MTTEQNNAQLMSAFGFSADDLEANRRAQLSAAQQQAEMARRARLASVARGGFSFLLLFYLLVLVAIGVALYITGTLAAFPGPRTYLPLVER